MGDWFAEKAAGAAEKEQPVEGQPVKCLVCGSDNLLYGRESGRASSKCRQCGSIQLWGPINEDKVTQVPNALAEIRVEFGGERQQLTGRPKPEGDLCSRIESEVRRKFLGEGQ